MLTKLYASIAITESCNYSCPYCLADSGHGSAVADISKIVEIVRHLRSFAYDTKITITGGEPTCSPNLIEVMKEIHAMGSKVKLVTNGSLNDYRYIAPFAHEIDFSMHGLTPNEYHANTKHHNFNLVLNNIRHSLKYFPKTMVNIIPHKDNVHMIPKFCRDLELLGVRRIRFSELYMIGRGHTFQSKQLEQHEVAHLKQEVIKHTSKMKRLIFMHDQRDLIVDNAFILFDTEGNCRTCNTVIPYGQWESLRQVIHKLYPAHCKLYNI